MPHVVNKDFNDLKDSKVNFAVGNANFQVKKHYLMQSQLSMRQLSSPLALVQGEYGEAGRGINTKKRIFVGTIFCVTIGQVLNNPSELHKELSPCTCAGGVRQSREGVNHLIRFYSDF